MDSHITIPKDALFHISNMCYNCGLSKKIDYSDIKYLYKYIFNNHDCSKLVRSWRDLCRPIGIQQKAYIEERVVTPSQMCREGSSNEIDEDIQACHPAVRSLQLMIPNTYPNLLWNWTIFFSETKDNEELEFLWGNNFIDKLASICLSSGLVT